MTVEASLSGLTPRSAAGETLTAPRVDSVNTFERRAFTASALALVGSSALPSRAGSSRFEASWDSLLEGYRVPEWFRDASARPAHPRPRRRIVTVAKRSST